MGKETKEMLRQRIKTMENTRTEVANLHLEEVRVLRQELESLEKEHARRLACVELNLTKVVTHAEQLMHTFHMMRGQIAATRNYVSKEPLPSQSMDIQQQANKFSEGGEPTDGSRSDQPEHIGDGA